jgi:hypothetical protein
MLEITDPRFMARADAHIDLSNRQCNEAPAGSVTLSMIDASCRFSVWLWAVASQDVAQLKSQRAEALQALLEETARRFDKHFDQYVENYEPYIMAQRRAAENGQSS